MSTTVGELACQRVSAEETHPLRHLVLRTGRPASTCIWDGDDQPSTLHFAILDKGKIISIGSLYERPHPAAPGPGSWQLRGMATHPDRRGEGHGARLLQRVVEVCRMDLGGHVIWCNARTSAAGFYRRHGFAEVGDSFIIPKIGPHFVMRRVLQPRVPQL